MVASGVSVYLSPSGGVAPGGTLTPTIYNRGSATDTFNLALSGPAALAATIGQSSVTLGPGANQQVQITTGPVTFATAGNLPLTVTATSQTNTAVMASATSTITVSPNRGLTVTASPASVTLAQPGPTSFLLLPQNTGTQDDSYEATIMGTTGPVAASLIGLDGLPTQSIPIFILPGLSSGAIELNTNLLSPGTGTVTIQFESTDGAGCPPPVTVNVQSQSTVSSTSVTVVSSPAFGVYGPGTTLPISVTFSGPVTVTGTPQLALNAGNGAVANYTSGSGTSTLTFTYSVAAGQTTSDLDYTSTTALGAQRGDDRRRLKQCRVVDVARDGHVTAWRRRTSPWGRSPRASRAAISSSWPWQLSASGSFAGRLDGPIERGPCGQFRRAIGRDRHGEQQHAEHHSHRGGRRRILLLAERVLGPRSGKLDLRDRRRASQPMVRRGALAGVVLLASPPERTPSPGPTQPPGTPAGSDAAWLDDVLFTPGTTLTVDGTPGNDQFTFDASGPMVIVSLNGESHSFAPGEFTNYRLPRRRRQRHGDLDRQRGHEQRAALRQRQRATR